MVGKGVPTNPTSEPIEGKVPPGWCAGLVYANKIKLKPKNSRTKTRISRLLLWVLVHTYNSSYSKVGSGMEEGGEGRTRKEISIVLSAHPKKI